MTWTWFTVITHFITSQFMTGFFMAHNNLSVILYSWSSILTHSHTLTPLQPVDKWMPGFATWGFELFVTAALLRLWLTPGPWVMIWSSNDFFIKMLFQAEHLHDFNLKLKKKKNYLRWILNMETTDSLENRKDSKILIVSIEIYNKNYKHTVDYIV